MLNLQGVFVTDNYIDCYLDYERVIMPWTKRELYDLLRVAITGSLVGLPLFETMAILGPAAVKDNINTFLKYVEGITDASL